MLVSSSRSLPINAHHHNKRNDSSFVVLLNITTMRHIMRHNIIMILAARSSSSVEKRESSANITTFNPFFGIVSSKRMNHSKCRFKDMNFANWSWFVIAQISEIVVCCWEYYWVQKKMLIFKEFKSGATYWTHWKYWI